MTPAPLPSHDPAVGLADPKAFTLIELMVVVTIITLLIAMLMPALGRARYSAQIVVCSSNFHQWALAANMYATANLGAYPRHDIPMSIGMNVWGLGNGTMPQLLKYGVKVDIWFCPLLPPKKLPSWMQFSAVPDAMLRRKDPNEILAYKQSFWPAFTMFEIMWWVPRWCDNGWLPHDDSAAPAVSCNKWPRSRTQPGSGNHPLISDLLGVSPSDGPLTSLEFVRGGHWFNDPTKVESVNAAWPDGHVELRTRNKFKVWQTQQFGNWY